MKKILGFIIVASLIFVNNCFAVSEWLKGQPAGSASPSDIDTLIQANNDALDRFMSYGRFGCKITYDTVAQFTVGTGAVICSNSTGAVRRTRTNASATTVTWADIDTGSEAASTTYYVYAVADTDVATFTIKISTNATIPTGVTYYARLGSVYNDSSSNITNITDDGSFDTVPSGTITMWSGALASPPSGWLVCDGSAVSQTTYAALYAIIGTIYGSNAGGNFTLPNFTNRFPYGANEGASAGNASVGSANTPEASLAGNDSTVTFKHPCSDTYGDSGAHPKALNQDDNIMSPYLAVGFIIKT